ncbi:hypothetical protein MRB53_001242 [Persea americana]|uniref:Uncharacterized protein n=1 Tax=Persea americana TaxID=3435 RepID=A0ACC2MR58_PERAE|nr:hypothetical protein MRB53_001242 [Persea americana]
MRQRFLWKVKERQKKGFKEDESWTPLAVVAIATTINLGFDSLLFSISQWRIRRKGKRFFVGSLSPNPPPGFAPINFAASSAPISSTGSPSPTPRNGNN